MNPRIITGSAKGRRLEVPERGCRPMTDRVKTALFSMINSIIPDASILDLFAGTGALGIECLSRGAKSAVFIDRSKHAITCINQNLEKTGLSSLARVIKCSASRFLDEYDNFRLSLSNYDIIFFTPPYKDFKEKIFTKTTKLLKKDGLLIAEHSSTREINNEIENLIKIDEREYGITGLSFYKISK